MCTLQRCEQNCNILILLKQRDVKCNLLHNKNNRYSENSVPVGEKVNVTPTFKTWRTIRNTSKDH